MANKITKEFLENILKEPIQDFTLSPGSNPGDNIQGVLLAIRVTTTSNKVIHLMHKGFPDGDNHPPRVIRFFRNEGVFYNSVLPLLRNTGSQPIPKYLGGVTDGKNDFLLMDDLRKDGYIMLNKFSGVPFQEACLVMKEIGKFHASTYQLVRFQGEQIFDNILANVFHNFWLTPEGLQTGKATFPGFWQTVIDIFSNRTSCKPFAEAMKKIDSNKIFDISTAVSKKTNTEYFPLIIHGDLWMNNILFKYDEFDKPSAIKFLDFQLARRGNVLEDLLYFILTSITPKVWKGNLEHFLSVYFDSFQNELEELNCPIPIGFTKGKLIDSFYKEILTGFVYLTFAVPLQLNDIPLELESEEEKKDLPENPPADDPDVMFVNMLRHLLTNSPRAIERLEAITKELVELRIL